MLKKKNGYSSILANSLYPILINGSTEISIEKAIECDLFPVTPPRSLLSSMGFLDGGRTRITCVRRETTDDE